MPMIGYARTSTVEQVAGLDAQVRDLKAAGCNERDIYREQVSSVAERPELDLLLSRIVRAGDVLVVTKLDRLARSTADLLAITARLKASGAALKVLDSPIDMTSPTGEFMLTVLGAVAQFERQIMLARQREGVAKAKAEGKYKGRKPTVRSQATEIVRLKVEDKLSDAEIARRLGVHRANVGRVLKTEMSDYEKRKAYQELASLELKEHLAKLANDREKAVHAQPEDEPTVRIDPMDGLRNILSRTEKGSRGLKRGALFVSRRD